MTVPDRRQEVERLLADLSEPGSPGSLERSAADRIFAIAYGELRAIARREMSKERSGHTLQPTALLNEAYLRLVDATRVEWRSKTHFFGIAVHAMRQVLIDHARRRGAAKRGKGWRRVMVEDAGLLAADHENEAVDIEMLLDRLGRLHPRMARVVELRVFGGLTGEEIALVLGVSRKTIVDDWRVASLWLRAAMGGAIEGAQGRTSLRAPEPARAVAGP